MRHANRRVFITETATRLAAAGLGAVAGVSPATTAAQSMRQSPKGFGGFQGIELAIATICVDGFANRRHEPALTVIPTLGFKNVEFNVWYADVISPAYFSSLKDRCEAAGLNPVGVQGGGFGHCGREGLVKDVAHKLLLMEGCQRLGCHMVKCTGARRGNEGGIEAVIATCREIAPAAEELGVVVTLENHAGNVLERPEDYDRVFQAIDSPNIGMCLDLGHFEGIGVDVHRVIERFSDRVLEVDLKDCRERGKGHDTVPFGEGVTNFDAILSQLVETGYEGFLVVEQAWPEPRGDWKSDLRSAHDRFSRWRRQG